MLFGERFPDLAEKETRTLMLLNEVNEWNLPVGRYIFLESYCNDPKCDCRRVLINVGHFRNTFPAASDKPKMLATIGYGWETLEYYNKWFGHGKYAAPKKVLQAIKGPILEIDGFHTEYSERVLKLFKESMLRDSVFIQRLKTHYSLFKGSV